MYNNAQRHLVNYGVRPSLQRLAVMDYLLTHETHPTVDQIFTALSPEIPTLSRKTVYNTVSTLAEHGAIKALDLEPGRTHYDGDTMSHAHFVCTECGMIIDLVPDLNFLNMNEAESSQGMLITGMQLTYKGLCPKCHKKHKREANKKEQQKNNHNIN
jgi:Fe2+ or Zn2+ uptake regulation protein